MRAIMPEAALVSYSPRAYGGGMSPELVKYTLPVVGDTAAEFAYDITFPGESFDDLEMRLATTFSPESCVQYIRPCTAWPCRPVQSRVPIA